LVILVLLQSFIGIAVADFDPSVGLLVHYEFEGDATNTDGSLGAAGNGTETLFRAF